MHKYFIDDLPDEIFRELFMFIARPKSYRICSILNRRWNIALDHPIIHQTVYENYAIENGKYFKLLHGRVPYSQLFQWVIVQNTQKPKNIERFNVMNSTEWGLETIYNLQNGQYYRPIDQQLNYKVLEKKKCKHNETMGQRRYFKDDLFDVYIENMELGERKWIQMRGNETVKVIQVEDWEMKEYHVYCIDNNRITCKRLHRELPLPRGKFGTALKECEEFVNLMCANDGLVLLLLCLRRKEDIRPIGFRVKQRRRK